MTNYDKAITDLVLQKQALKDKLDDLQSKIGNIELTLNKLQIPRGFEDGNSWDNYDIDERVSILANQFNLLKEQKYL
jgi:hypothetical protein